MKEGLYLYRILVPLRNNEALSRFRRRRRVAQHRQRCTASAYHQKVASCSRAPVAADYK
jgi:hypothetical protein